MHLKQPAASGAVLVMVSVLSAAVSAGQWRLQPVAVKTTYRTVSAVAPAVVWAAGSRGSFSYSTDGGANWQHGTVAGAEELDFRDVHAVDAGEAYLLSSGPADKSRIYKTMDGGRTWKLQFISANPKASFDGFAFWDDQNGIAVSDPIDGRFLIIRTTDGGESWWEIPFANAPRALPGETAFSTGASITVQGNTHAWLATGGAAARVLRSGDRGFTWLAAETPITAGSPSSGISSIAFRDELHGVIVGGNYEKPHQRSINFARTNDGGKTWTRAGQLPAYRSAVAYVSGPSGHRLLAVGPTGSDYSDNEGSTWQRVNSELKFHALSFFSDAPVGWAVGEAGAIGKWSHEL